MILLGVIDSLQVVSSTTDYVEWIKTFLIIVGGLISIYWIIFQIKQTRKNNKEKEKKNLNDDKQRKSSIQPELEINKLKQYTDYLVFELTNKRSEAKNIKLTDFDDSKAHSNFIARPLTYLPNLGTNESVLFAFTAKVNPTLLVNVIDNCLLHTEISYVDIEGNSYFQNINERVTCFDIFKPYKLSEPKEIKEQI